MIVEDMNRREFLKIGIGLAAVATGFKMIPGCTITEMPKDHINQAKEKVDYKIYPPQKGCFVGFYKQRNGREVSAAIDHYRNAFGAKPAILALISFLSSGFPVKEARTIRGNNMIPYIDIMPGYGNWNPSFDPNDIVQGRGDLYIKRLARDAVVFGKEYGGFFFTTMIEPNSDWWPWSRNPNTTHALKRIWQIFEDQGANRYATWVWEAFCPTRYGYHVDDPERYFPGDKYVDWIGFNVYANLKNRYISESTTFSDLISKSYKQISGNHPNKSMMVSGLGRSPSPNQPSWLVDAFQSMKNDFQSIKATIYYDTITAVLTGQDHRLDQKSLQTLKEMFKDPYWVMAK